MTTTDLSKPLSLQVADRALVVTLVTLVLATAVAWQCNEMKMLLIFLLSVAGSASGAAWTAFQTDIMARRKEIGLPVEPNSNTAPPQA